MPQDPQPSRDPHHLQRFVEAQNPVYPQVLAELRAGSKRTHWMWFIFPQIAGLGSSPTAQHFSIASLDEARAYLAHPTLGPRLRECTDLVLQHTDRTAAAIFAFPDDRKFHSSLTLFARAGQPAAEPFTTALQLFFHGEPDAATLARLNPSAPRRCTSLRRARAVPAARAPLQTPD